MSYLWNPVPAPVFNSTGSFASGAQIYFYVGNSTTPLIVYQDAGLSIPYSWPVIADVTGVFPPIYVPYGNYRRRVVTAQGVLISDAGNIDNPAPPSGGGGIVVNATQIFQTGDPIWRMATGIIAGFVRMNGNTLGNVSSGATEYAAADAAALFAYLWNGLPDTIAPVSSGRGASATADFTAGKTIVIPTMQGRLAAGVDDMGATAAAEIQAITTCSPTGSSNVIPVTSATNIAVGQYVIINGAAAGSVTAISGTNITISTTPSAGATVSWRSSFFPDAQQIGSPGGIQNGLLTSDQMPSHTHALTDPGHVHALGLSSGGGTYLSGSVANVSSPGSINSASATTGITLGNTGGGNPFGLLQPSRLGTWYQKL